MGCRVLLALLVLHRAKLLTSNQSILALGRSPPYRSSAICATASCSGFVWLTTSILAWTRGGSPGNIAPARMPGVYATRLCRTQSQPSIHSPSHGERGLGFRQGCRDRTPKGFMQGRIQVVEQSRCRTHRQQTTTIARTQSPQSVLIGIENLLYFYENRLFLQADEIIHFENMFTYQLINS